MTLIKKCFVANFKFYSILSLHIFIFLFLHQFHLYIRKCLLNKHSLFSEEILTRWRKHFFCLSGFRQQLLSSFYDLIKSSESMGIASNLKKCKKEF